MTEEKRGPGRPPKAAEAETVKAEVLRDYWVAADEAGRIRAGSIVEVSKDDLISGLEKGLLRRAE